MMRELEHLLEERDIEFDAHDRRIMCFPHIINICVKHVLDTDPADLADAFAAVFARNSDGDSDDDSDDFKEKYLEALKNNPIALGRQIVKAIRASGLRREEFAKFIKSCNSSDLFKFQGKVVRVPEHQLLRDVPTRWDSQYFMINCLRAMRVVCFFFHDSSLLLTISMAGYRLLPFLSGSAGYCATQDGRYGMARPPRL